MSQRPIVIAYHLVWTGYGWWLPNDPRGSTSTRIHSDVIRELGELHYGRKRLQPASRQIHEFYDRTQDALQYPLHTFHAREVATIAEAFDQTIAEHRYTCYACAIMPDHVHLVIRKHKHSAEQMIAHLQNLSRLRLRKSSPPFAPDHPAWGGQGWKVFLEDPDEIWRTIRYVEDNPVHAGLPRQSWDFVTPYDNWPLHEGHSPNSPYARRLRERKQG
jgi:REP element-mobilizing transposase RayT